MANNFNEIFSENNLGKNTSDYKSTALEFNLGSYYEGIYNFIFPGYAVSKQLLDNNCYLVSLLENVNFRLNCHY